MGQLSQSSSDYAVIKGHLDTVLQGEPFRRDGNRAYGSGTADMKGFIALSLAHAETISKLPLTRPVAWMITSMGAPADSMPDLSTINAGWTLS